MNTYALTPTQPISLLFILIGVLLLIFFGLFLIGMGVLGYLIQAAA